jgi:exopolysaccharide biosynthesis glucuronosyltransferase PssE
MIFVTIGNATQKFRRLLEAIDNMAGKGILKDDEVIIQSGNDRDFRASHCKQQDFLSPERFAELIREAEVIICHGGAGTLYHVFQAGKVPVVMPRRKKYGEHVDDQLALVKALAAEARIIPAYEPEELPKAIAEARSGKASPISRPPSRMLSLVAAAIQELKGANG